MADLQRFVSLGKKYPWSERLEIIKEEFPSAVQMDWAKAFDDIELMGRILRDILKVDQSKPGRSGPRPVLDRKVAEAKLRQFMGTDYSNLEFKDSFLALANGRSHRHLATKIGIDRNAVQKLLAGTKQPDVEIMEQVAKAFDKHPSYFLEYRLLYVLGALGQQMVKAPEMTVDLYRKLKRLDGSH